MDLPSSSKPSPPSTEDAEMLPTVFLMELFTLDNLIMTTSSSKRSKLTCIAVSPQFLFLGTSTGGVSAYARYSSRKRVKSPSGPIHFVNTKNGPVNTMCVSPKEGIVAVGSGNGRIHVIAFSTSPSPLVHLLTRDSRKLNKVGLSSVFEVEVTSLAWSSDSKTLYSGHANGIVVAHQTGANYFFRSSCTTIATFDEGDIVQLDVSNSKVLVSTQRASYICDIDQKTVIQIGKKLRSGFMGACIFPKCCETLAGTGNAFILAARPNGRVWEANFAGAVYRTHLLRDNVAVLRFPVISSRNGYMFLKKEVSSVDTTTDNIQLSILKEIVVEGVPFILSIFGSHLVVFDVEQSKVVLLNDLEDDIAYWCVCGPDVFVLLRGIPIPRKYTLCYRTTVVKRLLAKSLFTQSANFILHFETCYWPNDLIRMTVDSLPQIAKQTEVGRLRFELAKLLQRSNNVLDDTNEGERVQGNAGTRFISDDRNSESDCGVEKCVPRSSMVGLRSASYSEISTARSTVCRRASFPQSIADLRCDSRQNSLSSKTEKSSKAECDWDPRRHIVESDSLRTLLQLESSQAVEAVQFIPTVTIGNAAKSLAELAINTPTGLSCIVAAGSDATSSKEEREEKESTIKRRSGPNIVKVVKPFRLKPVASATPKSTKRFEKSNSSNVQSPEIAEESVSEEIHNKINANNLLSIPPASIGSTIELHDNENNLEAHWVIDRLIHMHGEIVPTTQLISKVTPSSPLHGDADYCDQCKIHRSWLIVALLARVCRRVNVRGNFIKTGAVPLLPSDWKKILEFRFSSLRKGRSPCAQCETALCRCLSIFRQGHDSLDLTPESVRPNAKKILERCISKDEERLLYILLGSCLVLPTEEFSKHRSSLLDGSDSHATTINGNSTSKYRDKIGTFNQDGCHDIFQETLFLMDWLLDLDARVVLAVASVVIGCNELISVIKESSCLLSQLRPEHWSALAFLCVRDQVMKKNEIPAKVISEILYSFNMDKFVNVDSSGSAALRKHDDTQKQTPMYSWIIDCNNCCPICVLSLKSDVVKDLGITSFICGHAYHTICLSGRFGTCLVCRGRAKSRGCSRISRTSKLE